MNKAVLAFSGGLDTTVCIKLLEEKYNMNVITACVDVGQDKEDIKQAETIAKKYSYKHYTIDAKDEFVEEYVYRAIKANAIYEGYPLSTALARPLIAKKVVEIAEKEKADVIAHGCTGKGNDQFRFESTIRAISDCKIVAPIRDLNLTREEEIKYAKEHGIEIPSGKKYSIDENIWGRSIEGNILENPDVEPPEDVFMWTNSIHDAPEEPENVEIEFDSGVPVSINQKNLEPVEIVKKANEIAGRHGIGRIDIVEDRIIGIKSREIYEAPAASLLITAHKSLEQLTLTREELKFCNIISEKYAELIYNGLWHEPLREDLDRMIDHMQRRVTGSVTLKLHKGSIRVVARDSPYALYRKEMVSFDEKAIDQREIAGMVKNYGIQALIYNKMFR